MIHVDSFTCSITEKGRSPIIEAPESPGMRIEEGLLVLASAEQGDAADGAGVAIRTAQEIASLAAQLKVHQVMVLPFAHLFADLAPPQQALALMDGVVAELRAAELAVQRPPFGWFHTWDMQAKGHPLSRVARTVRPTS
jgi:hypothetical protein